MRVGFFQSGYMCICECMGGWVCECMCRCVGGCVSVSPNSCVWLSIFLCVCGRLSVSESMFVFKRVCLYMVGMSACLNASAEMSVCLPECLYVDRWDVCVSECM